MRIINGGQTGVETGALLAAVILGLETGGWAPKGWETGEGPEEEFMREMGIEECRNGDYRDANIRESQATLFVLPAGEEISGMAKPGYYAFFHSAGVLTVMTMTDSGSNLPLKSFITLHDIKVLYVTGPKSGEWPGGCEMAYNYLVEALGGE